MLIGWFRYHPVLPFSQCKLSQFLRYFWQQVGHREFCIDMLTSMPHLIMFHLPSQYNVWCHQSKVSNTCHTVLNHCGTLQADIWHAALLEQTVNWHKQLPFLEHGGVLRFRDVTVGLYSSARAAQPHRFVTPNSVSIFTLSSG